MIYFPLFPPAGWTAAGIKRVGVKSYYSEELFIEEGRTDPVFNADRIQYIFTGKKAGGRMCYILICQYFELLYWTTGPLPPPPPPQHPPPWKIIGCNSSARATKYHGLLPSYEKYVSSPKYSGFCLSYVNCGKTGGGRAGQKDRADTLGVPAMAPTNH